MRMMSMQESSLLSTLTRQMISIALLQIIIILLFQAVYGITQVYTTTTASLAKDPYRQAQESV
jgi:predicted membrane chloride channel (bestrophin family)